MNKIWKAIALALCLILLTGTAAAAAEDSGDADPPVPRVTFTNQENTTPDLYVTKTVESLDAAYPAPEDAEFSFVVKVDGEFYSKQEYELYKKDMPSGQAPERRKTDRNGCFSLKAGERARFVYVGAGKHYEVYEEDLPERFVQIIPAQGTSVTGTIPPGGASAAFTNQYQPPTPPGTKPKTTKLMVSKRVAFPAGYTPPETPVFWFRVALDGKPFTEEVFDLYSLDTGLKTGSGVTGKEGEFSLLAGTYALFPEVPIDVDYRVEELLEKAGQPAWTETSGDGTAEAAEGTGEEGTEGPGTDGGTVWWSTDGQTSAEGATQAPQTVVGFTNASTSFIVTKQMDDNTKPEEDFSFLLTHGDKSLWGGAQYYLYSTKGERLDGGIHTTDENGRFLLKPGQAAVFFGIEPGTVYNVSEVKDPRYSQLTPEDPAGYTDKVVQMAPEVLPFVNHKEENKGVLTVTKAVEVAGGNVPENQPEFRFRISSVKENAQGTDQEDTRAEASTELPGTATPLNKARYEVSRGTLTEAKETGEDGTFSIKAGETARFSMLLPGTYRVEELTEGLSKEYSIAEEDRVQQGTLTLKGEEGLAFTFTNRFDAVPLDIQVKKQSYWGGEALSGAVFRLYYAYVDGKPSGEVVPEDWEKTHPGEPFPGYISDADGTFTIEGLQAGTYYLEEKKAPDGYQLLASPIRIEIVREGRGLSATVNGIKPSLGEPAQIEMVNDTTVGITVNNSKNFTLPSTGGGGIAFLLAAAAGMAALLASLWKKGKVKRKES